MTSLQFLCESRISLGAELEMFGLSRRMRPSWFNKAALSTLGCPVTGTSLWAEAPCSWRPPHYTADHSTDFRFHMEKYRFKPQPGAPVSSHTAALECFLLIWVLGHQAVTFPALHLSLYPKPLCAPASHLVGTDLSCCPAGGHRSVSHMGTIAFLEDAQAL